jgi:hypothetical protein
MHGHPDRLCVREGSEKREMMDLELWKQRREELMHEAKQNRLARALRDPRKRRGAGWHRPWRGSSGGAQAFFANS